MIGLLLGLGIILARCGSRRSTADDTVTSEEIQMDRIVVGFFPAGSGIRLAQCQHGVHEKHFYKGGRV